MRGSITWIMTIAVTWMACGSSHGAEVDFSDLTLDSNTYWNGSDLAGGFESGGLFFNNSYDADYLSWSGWAYSNVSNSSVGGFGNQYASITGSGVSGTGSIYAVSYTGDPNAAYVNLGGEHVLSMRVTNTAYAYYSMKNGDAFARKFGPDDWFKLTIRSFSSSNAQGVPTGSVDFFLATGTNILNQWTSIDLTSLPTGTLSLGFELTSSDNGIYGMNTPAYFALGSLTVAPEPGSVVLASIGVLTAAAIGLRRRSRS
ncbi:DUF4465 domain-containing protein [bacterium]|nr:DUF4465 domain-containing protein [bacterium]